jgi:pyruvate-formate lyase
VERKVGAGTILKPGGRKPAPTKARWPTMETALQSQLPEAYASWCTSLRESVRRDGANFAERDLLAAEAFRETEGETYRVLRVSRATSRIFARMPVLIREGEMLVGWHPSTHPDGDMGAAIKAAREYLAGQNYWVPASEGHMAPDYETVLRLGLGGIRRRILKLSAGLAGADVEIAPRRAFYEAALESLTALQNLILRYAREAERLLAEEGPSEWRGQLARISEVCRRIASRPPRDFREAIQLSWFVFLAVAIEASTTHHCFGPGHIDRYLLPFYRSEGDRDQARALLDQLFIKCNEFTGLSMSAVIVGIGGRNPDGGDATNELTWECLAVSERVRMYFPGLDILWHRDMDPDFVRAACSLLRNGNGQPSFFNTDLIIRGLGRCGIPYEHAVEHLPSTCTETSIQGRSNPWVAWTYENVAMCLVHALFGGRNPATGEQEGPDTGVPESYEDLEAAFFAHLEHTAKGSIAKGVGHQMMESIYRPFPLLSCFVQDCLSRGLDISHGGALYNFLQPEAVGVSNAVDGLAAIRTLVKERKIYTMADFRRAVETNFDGDGELRRAILRECPKHGNNEPFVNDLFARVAGAWCSALEHEMNYLGGPVLPGFLGWTVWIGFGQGTPATPDGRPAGQPLANCIGPCTGVRVKGAPSALLSTCGLDQSRGLGGIVHNLRFSPNAMADGQGLERLKSLLETSFDLGVFQIQVNLTGTDVLRDAQARPEEHADLLVRIGGYLVPFTQLPAQAQEDVIARTEMEIG